MIDLKQAEKSFLKETEKYDLTNENIKRKQLHSLRVRDYARKIAKELDLTDKQIDIATRIGLLHDIGRFEQYQKFKTFWDLKSVDHGDLGVEILKENNKIREFIEEADYDSSILTAIKNHNKYQIEEGLDPETLIFCKIIRDADKLDIFYEGAELFWKDMIEKINQTKITDEIMELVKEEKSIQRKKVKSDEEIDSIITFVMMVYDLNFKESFVILKEADYINQIISRFDLKDLESKKRLEAIRIQINEFIEKKVSE